MHSTLRVFIIAGLLTAITAFTGCSGSAQDPADTVATSAPPTNVRFASAQDLIDEFNALTTTEPVNIRALAALYYAENGRQQSLIALLDSVALIVPLDEAMQARFRQPIDPATPKAFVGRANGPAKLTAGQGERATATYRDWDGSTETLQLVKYNGRWWISGYTVEHHPKLKNTTEDDILVMSILYRSIAAIAPPLTARVNAGEFKTADAVRQAMQMAAAQHAVQNPADARTLVEVGRRNPKYAAFAAAAAGAQRQP
jgi:hypothetical protein